MIPGLAEVQYKNLHTIFPGGIDRSLLYDTPDVGKLLVAGVLTVAQPDDFADVDDLFDLSRPSSFLIAGSLKFLGSRLSNNERAGILQAAAATLVANTDSSKR